MSEKENRTFVAEYSNFIDIINNIPCPDKIPIFIHEIQALVFKPALFFVTNSEMPISNRIRNLLKIYLKPHTEQNRDYIFKASLNSIEITLIMPNEVKIDFSLKHLVIYSSLVQYAFFL